MATGSFIEQMAKNGPLTPHVVRILLAAPKLPAQATLLAALEKGGVRVEALDDKQGPSLGFAYPDHRAEFEGGKRVPILHFYTLQEGLGEGTHLEQEALQQTWEWRGARKAVASAHAVLLVSDMMAASLDRKDRLEVFQRAVRAVLPLVPACAIDWVPSQRMVDPVAYLSANPERGRVSAGPVNIRLFRVEGRSPGECVMDSMGMNIFGLPDVQCHFAGIEPGRVAGLLYGYATYLFENGDVIADGNTADGLEPGSRWTCQHEEALVEPKRVVLDLNPGRPQGSRPARV